MNKDPKLEISLVLLIYSEYKNQALKIKSFTEVCIVSRSPIETNDHTHTHNHI